MMLRRYLLSFFLLIIAVAAAAQGRISVQSSDTLEAQKRNVSLTNRVLSPYSISIRGGLTQFFGELGDQDMKFMTGLSLIRQVNPAFAMSLDLAAGKLGGQKREFFNSYFINEFNSIGLLARWDLTEQFSRYADRSPFHLSVYSGLSIMYFSANAFDLDTDQRVRFTNSDVSGRNPLFLRWGSPQGPLGVSRTHERMIPVGLMLKYQLSENWQAGLDYRFYFARSDKLDATSGRRLINPEESTTYSDTPNDKYSFLSVTLTHRFNRKVRDADNDGIPDERDRCPNTAGVAKFFGCPDTDSDGIPDYVDKCPNVAGTKATRGCPDTDKDGVIDRLDECPNLPGKVKGCPDRDGDGVRDAYDGCPDVKGLLRFGGCPDTDKDGIPDHVDKCPNLPGRYRNEGCPVNK
ncbi:thrombospondin type 3 repeat-containing protein [Persicitalea jodogahamensis]|uniref:Uncharacterized protein n=1 Tax=Persicitalea jodogahamensis TaxID=402147 RepID=A0A8J3GAW7_9BACT|nr:thrombospondin type 3 repeat-containing protein [Persicitalea jodogahamensis]GHB83211.1 hypothetical protein GCM10007390_42730 [Persicitalea jodogahamensis]